MPRPLALLELGRRLVLAQTAARGVPMAIVVRRRLRGAPRASAQDHDRVLRWLARLHAAPSGGAQRVDPAAILERVARALPSDAPGRRRTLSRVHALSREWPACALPLLPGHGDLGATNCFVDGDELHVIDWEGGIGLRTPLAEVVVFLVQYARSLPLSRHRLLDRFDAFRAAFLADTWLAELTARTFRQYLRHLDLPPAAAEYLFVATLADLAAGVAPIAHPAGTVAYWTQLLRLYADEHGAAKLRA